MQRYFLTAILVSMALVFSFAGISNWDAIKLTGIGTDTNILEIENSAGMDVLVATNAGAVTMGGTCAITGGTTFTGALDINGAVNLDAGTVVTEQVGCYHTLLRVGTGATADVAGAIAADGLFVEGDVEFDDTARFDGAIDANAALDVAGVATFSAEDVNFDETGGSTSDPDFDVDGYAKLNGTVEIDGALDIDGSVNYDAASVVTEQVGCYHTLLRIGTGATADVAGAIAADGLFVEGDVEFDAAARFDGAIDINSSVEFDAASVITESAGAYHTQVRIGTGATPDVAASIAADGLFVEGEIEIDGAARFDGAVALNSTVTYAATKSFWLGAGDWQADISQGSTVTETEGIPVHSFADETTDDEARVSFVMPEDFDESAVTNIYIHYSVGGGIDVPTEGEWALVYGTIGDGDACVAPALEPANVLDTPTAVGTLNVCAAYVIAAAAITEDDVVTLHILHDVSDPFGATAYLHGVTVEYTSDKP